MPFGTIPQAIDDIRRGKLVIIADDEDRESEGDLVGAAQLITPDHINFMARYGRGLVCLTLTPDRCDALGLPQMAEHNSDSFETAFTVSVDADKRFGVTTGISAADRAKTVQISIDPATVPADLRRPGHVFPLRARPGGVPARLRLEGPGAEGWEGAAVLREPDSRWDTSLRETAPAQEGAGRKNA